MEKLLLIEDETLLVEQLKAKLSADGYLVDTALDGGEAEYLLAEYDYDLIILDLGLPKKSGLAILETLRDEQDSTPVLILTARNTWQERVQGLKKGADDYLGKPFHYEELLARIEVLLKRPSELLSTTLTSNGCELDLDRRELATRYGTFALTKTEFVLMKTFMNQPYRVFSKDQLLNRLGDHTYDRESNVIEVYIRKLRQYVGKTSIETLRGQGYRFVGEGDSA